MRDTDHERELLERAGLAADGLGDGEALTAVDAGLATAAGTNANTEPAKDVRPFRGTLARLRREAGDAIEQFIALLELRNCGAELR
jgi:hypothetical protein